MTKAPGMQIIKMHISDSCRDLHGYVRAFDLAIQSLRSEYMKTVEARHRNKCNEGSTYHLLLTVEETGAPEADPTDQVGRPGPGETIEHVQKGDRDVSGNEGGDRPG